MSKCDDLIVKYVVDLMNKLGFMFDMDLLIKVVIGCGLLIYSNDVEIIVGLDKFEFECVWQNYFVKKLGLFDGDDLMVVIDSVMQ